MTNKIKQIELTAGIVLFYLFAALFCFTSGVAFMAQSPIAGVGSATLGWCALCSAWALHVRNENAELKKLRGYYSEIVGFLGDDCVRSHVGKLRKENADLKQELAALQRRYDWQKACADEYKKEISNLRPFP